MADGSGCIASARVGSRQSFKSPEYKLWAFLLSKFKYIYEIVVLEMYKVIVRNGKDVSCKSKGI
jgi:hypothetical protein